MINRVVWRISVVCVALCSAMITYAQSGTAEELQAANTAGTCSYLSQVEKDVILYNNLARMYPAKFASIELRGQRESGYLTSLRNELNSMSALHPLTVHRASVNDARCWAVESGKRGITGHNRVGCDRHEAGHAWGENCSYGKNTGRDIILQLLIDEGISNLGHRRNCLSRTFRSVGVGYATHTAYRFCCVMDFTDEQGESYNASVSSSPSTTSSSLRAAPSQPSSTTVAQAPSQNLAPKKASASTAAPTVTTTTVTTPATTTTSAATPAPTEAPTSRLLDRYFEHSGYHTLSYISVGYTYSFMNMHHLMTFSILDFRTTLLGISPLSTELSISPLDTRVAYKPTVRIYIPVAKYCAVVPYGGAAVDISGIGKVFSQTYDYQSARDFYASAIAGVAVNFSAAKHVPAEIKVEYRHPIVVPTGGTISPQGVYLGAQIYVGSTFDKK